MAKQVTKIDCAIAQTMNAIGAAPPSFSAMVAGRTKMLAPIVVFTMFAVSAGSPMPRTSWASVSTAAAARDVFGIQRE